MDKNTCQPWRTALSETAQDASKLGGVGGPVLDEALQLIVKAARMVTSYADQRPAGVDRPEGKQNLTDQATSLRPAARGLQTAGDLSNEAGASAEIDEGAPNRSMVRPRQEAERNSPIKRPRLEGWPTRGRERQPTWDGVLSEIAVALEGVRGAGRSPPHGTHSGDGRSSGRCQGPAEHVERMPSRPEMSGRSKGKGGGMPGLLGASGEGPSNPLRSPGCGGKEQREDTPWKKGGGGAQHHPHEGAYGPDREGRGGRTCAPSHPYPKRRAQPTGVWGISRWPRGEETVVGQALDKKPMGNEPSGSLRPPPPPPSQNFVDAKPGAGVKPPPPPRRMKAAPKHQGKGMPCDDHPTKGTTFTHCDTTTHTTVPKYSQQPPQRPLLGKQGNVAPPLCSRQVSEAIQRSPAHPHARAPHSRISAADPQQQRGSAMMRGPTKTASGGVVKGGQVDGMSQQGSWPKAVSKAVSGGSGTSEGVRPRPFSNNIDISFKGGPPPKFDPTLHGWNLQLANRDPIRLRRRIRADIMLMCSTERQNNRALNYNLFRCFGLTITELKEIFQARTFSEVVGKCVEYPPDKALFGDFVVPDPKLSDAQSGQYKKAGAQSLEKQGSLKVSIPHQGETKMARDHQTCAYLENKRPDGAATAPKRKRRRNRENKQVLPETVGANTPLVGRGSGGHRQTEGMRVEGAGGGEAPEPPTDRNASFKTNEVLPKVTTGPYKEGFGGKSAQSTEDTDLTSTLSPGAQQPKGVMPNSCSAARAGASFPKTHEAKPRAQNELSFSRTADQLEDQVITSSGIRRGPESEHDFEEWVAKSKSFQTERKVCSVSGAGKTGSQEKHFSSVSKLGGDRDFPKEPTGSESRDGVGSTDERVLTQDRVSSDEPGVGADKRSILELEPRFSADEEMLHRAGTVLHLGESVKRTSRVPSGHSGPGLQTKFSGDTRKIPKASTASQDLAHSSRNPKPRPNKSSHGEQGALAPRAGLLDIVGELGSYPRDHPKVVLRNPDRFGDLNFDSRSNTMTVTLSRVPTELTKGEKKYMLRCETTGHVNRANFHDISYRDMVRCPLSACGHSIINQKFKPKCRYTF